MPTTQTERKRVDKLYYILTDVLGLDMVDTTAIIKTLWPLTPIQYPIPNEMRSLIIKRIAEINQPITRIITTL